MRTKAALLHTFQPDDVDEPADPSLLVLLTVTLAALAIVMWVAMR
jgi:hypothetical protein